MAGCLHKFKKLSFPRCDEFTRVIEDDLFKALVGKCEKLCPIVIAIQFICHIPIVLVVKGMPEIEGSNDKMR